MPLLNDAQIQPMYLAYSMLNASVDEAHALSKKFAYPWTVSATIEAAQMLADEGMFMKAESLLHDVGALNKAKDQAQLFRAELASIIAQGNTQRASARLAQERSINKFLIKDPRVTTQAEDLAELGNAFLMASNAAAASECFQSALDLAPDLASAMNNLAWLRMEHNQIDSATIDLVKRALAMTPNDPSTLDTAGWLAYRQGQLLDSAGELGAISLLRQSIEQSQDRASAESMDHYADALYRTGATGKAAELWRMIEDSEANKSSRENVVKAFQILQQREWGIRAWNADAFYDRNDGAAIDRAAKKLKAIAKGEAPELADMDFAQPSPAPAKDLSPSQGSATSTGAK
jgi:tetratricopeptide (TPR) repeat protein